MTSADALSSLGFGKRSSRGDCLPLRRGREPADIEAISRGLCGLWTSSAFWRSIPLWRRNEASQAQKEPTQQFARLRALCSWRQSLSAPSMWEGFTGHSHFPKECRWRHSPFLLRPMLFKSGRWR